MAAEVNQPMGGPIANKLAPLAADGADAGQIADAAVAVWDAIHRALSPVIGPRGSAALHHRTLHVARAAYPWLAEPYETSTEPGDFGALRATLAGQTAAEAAAAHDSMLQTFLDLLTTLIGESLTERLLQAVWAPPSSGLALQDPSP